MIKYEVGSPFPFPHPMPGADVTLAEITNALFDVKCYISNAQPGEIKDWRKGNLKYGFFEYDKCPFFILKFGEWDIDCSINVLKIKSSEDLNSWLNAEGNLINLFLIDSRTNILTAMRTITILKETAENLRDILEAQTEKYSSAEDVERRIAEIQHALTTAEMIRKTKMHTL